MENKTVIRAENTNSSSKNLPAHHVPGQWLILYSSFFAEWSLKEKKGAKKKRFLFSTGCFFERRKRNLIQVLEDRQRSIVSLRAFISVSFHFAA